jgi:hypothetical protein
MPATATPAPATSKGPADSNKPRRAPNFGHEEDKQLAKSWVVISEDAIRSNNQKLEDFWARVLEDFNKYTPGPRRDASGISIR